MGTDAFSRCPHFLNKSITSPTFKNSPAICIAVSPPLLLLCQATTSKAAAITKNRTRQKSSRRAKTPDKNADAIVVVIMIMIIVTLYREQRHHHRDDHHCEMSVMAVVWWNIWRHTEKKISWGESGVWSKETRKRQILLPSIYWTTNTQRSKERKNYTIS